MFVLNLGVLWIRAGGRHTYPSDGAFETQCVVYDPGHLLSLSHSTRPEVRLNCFWYRFLHMLWQASLSTPRWFSDKLVTGIFILPVVRCLGSVPRPRVKLGAGRVSTYSSFARSIWQHCSLVMGRKPVLVPFFPMVLQASSSMSRWYASAFLSVAQGVTTIECAFSFGNLELHGFQSNPPFPPSPRAPCSV